MIEKDKFVFALEAIQQQMHKDKMNSALIQEAFSINEDFLYDNSLIIRQIIDLLAIWFDKDELNHYIFDLNFGKPSPDSECETIGEFYDRLIKAYGNQKKSTCIVVRKCRNCKTEVSCEKDFCSEKCEYSYFR